MTIPPWPRRVCVVSDLNPYVHAGGNTTYLDALVRALAALGAELHLRAARGILPSQLRVAAACDPAFLSPYRSARLRGTRRLGGFHYATHPRHLVGKLRRLATGWRGDPPETGWLAPLAPDDAAWLVAELRDLAPDLVVAHYFNAASIFPSLGPGPRKAILMHDVIAARVESRRAAGQSPDTHPGAPAAEASAFAAADLCLAIKPSEAAHVAAVAPGTASAVFAPAVDIPAGPLDGARPPMAVFLGSRNNANDDAVRWLLAEIWPLVHARRPDARLRILGRAGEAWGGAVPPGVELAGFRPDLATDLAAAALAIAPMRFGSGVKIKVVEALAAGLPVVATPTGADGIEGAPPAALRVAETAPALAEAVLAALAEPEPAAARHAARAFATAHHGRAAVAASLRAALDRIAPPAGPLP